jgi:5-methylcytosine-specific restriction enzyme A
VQTCAQPRCPTLVEKGYCPQHARTMEQARPNADIRRWYHTAMWLRLRAVVIAEEPLCRDCLKVGRATPTTDVDHIERHRGVWAMFFNRSNLQGLCHSCHSRKTQRGE